MTKDQELTSRERVRLILNHMEADRVPIDFGSTGTNLTDAVYFDVLKNFNIQNAVTPFTIGHSATHYDERIISRFDPDFRHVHLKVPQNMISRTKMGVTFYNEWGVLCKRVGPYVERIGKPLEKATIKDLEAYPWPNTNDKDRIEGLKERIEHLFYSTDYAIIATVVDNGPFEIALQLRGFGEFLIDMIDNEEFANVLLKKITKIEKELLGLFLNIVGKYIEIVQIGDDLGTQFAPLISPEMYRSIIKPFHKDIFNFIKQKTNAKILFHSDGQIAPFIPDLIEAGIDILNPLQPTGPEMDAQKIKESFGDRLCFHGGIDIQHIMRQSSPKIIEHEIKTKIKALAPGGGYILATTHNIQPDTPIRNIELMFKFMRRYGKYPINI